MSEVLLAILLLWPPGDLCCFMLSCRVKAEARVDNEEPDGHGSADPLARSAEVAGGPSTVRASLHGEVCTQIHFKNETSLQVKDTPENCYLGAQTKKTWLLERKKLSLFCTKIFSFLRLKQP